MRAQAKSTAVDYLGLLLVFVFWGSLYVVSKVLLGSLPTFFVAFVRYVVAYLFLTAVFLVRRHAKKNADPNAASGAARPDPTAKKYICLMGILGYTVSVGLQLLGTKLTGASAASLINATNPIAITIMAALLLKEKLTKSKIIGIVLAVAGVYLIIGIGSGLNPLGVICSICSVLGWAFSSVMVRKKLSGTDPLVVTRNAAGIALICTFVLCIGEMLLTGSGIRLDAKAVIGLVYLGICCTGLTNILWNRSLARLPASNCSALYPVQPLVSTILGVIFLKETVGIRFFVGAACITVGILISLGILRRRSRPISSPEQD